METNIECFSNQPTTTDREKSDKLWVSCDNDLALAINRSVINEAKLLFATDWLHANYEDCDGVSVARCLIYDHYVQTCIQTGQENVNPASFGKVIRSIFPSLKTRRLGTRGNSKYHYYGIQPKNINDPIVRNQITVPERSMRGTRLGFSMGECRSVKQKDLLVHSIDDGTIEQHQQSGENFTRFCSTRRTRGSRQKRRNNTDTTSRSENSTQPSQKIPHPASDVAGNNHRKGTVENMSLLDADIFLQMLYEFTVPIPTNIIDDSLAELLHVFVDCYRLLCFNILKFILAKDYLNLENTIKEFWSKIFRKNAECLIMPETLRIIAVADEFLSFTLIDNLAGDPFSNNFNSQTVKILVKYWEVWNLQPLDGYPPAVLHIKEQSVCRIVSTLKRRATLHQLFITFNSILTDKEQIKLLQKEWELVDFKLIGESVLNTLSITQGLVNYVQRGVKCFLDNKVQANKWIEWINSLIENCTIATEKASNFPREVAIKQFLQRWSFFLSQIMRDLTVRNSLSFGSFHLVRSFLDEYVLYYTDRQIDEQKRFQSDQISGSFDRSSETASEHLYHSQATDYCYNSSTLPDGVASVEDLSAERCTSDRYSNKQSIMQNDVILGGNGCCNGNNEHEGEDYFLNDYSSTTPPKKLNFGEIRQKISLDSSLNTIFGGVQI